MSLSLYWFLTCPWHNFGNSRNGTPLELSRRVLFCDWLVTRLWHKIGNCRNEGPVGLSRWVFISNWLVTCYTPCRWVSTSALWRRQNWPADSFQDICADCAQSTRGCSIEPGCFKFKTPSSTATRKIIQRATGPYILIIAAVPRLAGAANLQPKEWRLFSGSAGPVCAHLCIVHTASHGAFCSDLTTWSVLQRHWCRLEAITAVWLDQWTKIDLKTFLQGVRVSIISIFWPETDQLLCFWSS